MPIDFAKNVNDSVHALSNEIDQEQRSRALSGPGSTLEQRIDAFIEAVQAVYDEWFPKAKSFSDDHLAEEVFEREIKWSKAETWVRYQLACALNSVQRTKNRLLNPPALPIYQPEAHLGDVMLLGEMVSELQTFMEVGSDYMPDKTPVRTGAWKRNVYHSREVFEQSRMLLRKQIISGSMGDFPLTGTAVVLIRVTIELRLWNMYGLEAITDRYGRSLKVPVELLLAYTKQNFNKLVFPVKYSQLEKIFKWTNYSIHGGLAPYVWQIEFAHHLISALYVSGEHNGVRYAFGAVKVPRHVYDGIEPFIWSEYNPRRKKGISRLAWIYRLLARIGARKIQPRNDIRIIRLENPESIII